MKYVIITLEVTREGQHYVSRCRELGTASFGSSEEEAIEKVLDATEVYLNTLEELGECDQVLKRKGVAIRVGGSAAQRLVCLPNSSIHPGVIPLGLPA